MRKLILTIVVGLFLCRSIVGQDPGDQDSIIIEDAVFGGPAESVFARVYAVTDDPVAFYNAPLRFTATGQGISFSHVSYQNTILEWDENFHDFLTPDDYLRMFGVYDTGGDDNPAFNTAYQREHFLNIVFDVAPDATDQIISINMAFDEINGPLLLGLVDGRTEFSPGFESGQITYGTPADVPTLSQWGFLILCQLTLAAGTVALVRRHKEIRA